MILELQLKNFALKNKYSFFDIKTRRPFKKLDDKNINHRRSNGFNSIFYEDQEKIELLMNFLKDQFKEITSLLYTINNKANNTIYDQKIICYSGLKYINEKIEDLSF